MGLRQEADTYPSTFSLRVHLCVCMYIIFKEKLLHLAGQSDSLRGHNNKSLNLPLHLHHAIKFFMDTSNGCLLERERLFSTVNLFLFLFMEGHWWEELARSLSVFFFYAESFGFTYQKA